MTALAPSTRVRYTNALSKVFHVCGTNDLHEVVLSPCNVSKLRRSITNPGTLHVTLTAIVSVLRGSKGAVGDSLREHWYPALAQVSREVKRVRESGAMTPRQREAYVPWETVAEKYRALARNAYGSRDHLLLAMYYLIPPRRQLDYAAVAIGTGKPGTASLDVTCATPYILVEKFKTVKHMDAWKRTLPKALVNVIRASLDARPRDYLFVNDAGEPYSGGDAFAQTSNRTLKRLFGRPVTVNTLRHSYATYVAKTNSRSQERVAYDMGHSVTMHKTYVFNDAPTVRGRRGRA